MKEESTDKYPTAKPIKLSEIKKFVEDEKEHPAAAKREFPSALKLFACFALASVLWLVWAHFDDGGSDPGRSAGMARVQAENAVRNLLVDPGSAQFSDQFHGRRDGTWCGYVNARNSLGGYAGDQRFISLTSVAFLERSMDANEFEEIWASACR